MPPRLDLVVPGGDDHPGHTADQLRRSLTWNQGKEMARHREFPPRHDITVYFCDSHSPWQRDRTKTPWPGALPFPKAPTCRRTRRGSRRRCTALNPRPAKHWNCRHRPNGSISYSHRLIDYHVATTA
jgi:hypothetical protein